MKSTITFKSQKGNGSFPRLVQEYIRSSGMSEEEREALVEAVKQLTKIKCTSTFIGSTSVTT